MCAVCDVNKKDIRRLDKPRLRPHISLYLFLNIYIYIRDVYNDVWRDGVFRTVHGKNTLFNMLTVTVDMKAIVYNSLYIRWFSHILSHTHTTLAHTLARKYNYISVQKD